MPELLPGETAYDEGNPMALAHPVPHRLVTAQVPNTDRIVVTWRVATTTVTCQLKVEEVEAYVKALQGAININKTGLILPQSTIVVPPQSNKKKGRG